MDALNLLLYSVHSSIQLTKAWISLLRSNDRNFHWTRIAKKIIASKIYLFYIYRYTYPNKKSQACRWRRQRQLTWRRVGSEASIEDGGGRTERWEFRDESFIEFRASEKWIGSVGLMRIGGVGLRLIDDLRVWRSGSAGGSVTSSFGGLVGGANEDRVGSASMR